MPDSPRSLPLVFEQPRGRKKPPRHLADLMLVPGVGQAKLERYGEAFLAVLAAQA